VTVREQITSRIVTHPMNRRRKIIFVVIITAIAAVAWIAYSVIHTLQHIPQAYAAWDTGTLLVEYMKQHEDHWPTSWDDLLTMMDTESGRQIPLRGARAGDVQYARSLREKVAIDWSFDPHRIDQPNPVTPPGRVAFPVVWQGAEPNEMVRAYLKERASTRPTDPR
jgi:hypothetical protein